MKSEPILICFDGSEHAARAVHVAAELLAGRKAVVVDIGQLLTESESYVAMAPEADTALLENLNLDAALERAHRGAEIARSAGFDAEPRAELIAPTWQGIVALADEIDAAAIVTGSRGLKGIREVVEGSLSHQLAQHAKRPVVIVPPAD
jgi:nucleotide-binding universal stress UspA family protein